jgi:hypothetical protein
MRQIIVSIACLLSVSSLAAEAPSRFVPWSPLTEEEIARAKARIPSAQNDEIYDKVLRDPKMSYRYRESDILAAYPELRGSKKLSSCSNRIMTGATSIIFVSHIGDHEVTLKSLSCSGARGGVLCGKVTTKRHYFLNSFREPIELLNVSPDSARLIAETYQARRVDNLPDWFQGGFPELHYIAALGEDRYRLIFGDYFCAGCSFRYDARLDTAAETPRLVVIGNADGGCF